MTDRFGGFFEQQQDTQTSDRFGAFFEQDAAATNQRVESVLEAASRTDPNAAARARALSADTGLPEDIVSRNLADVERRTRAVKLAQAAQTDPILQQQLTNPDFAKLAHDDVEQLGMGERAMRNFTDYGMRTQAQGVWSVSKGLAGLVRATLRTPAPLLDPIGRLFEGDRYDPEKDNPLRVWARPFEMQAAGADAMIREYGVNSAANTSSEFGKMVQQGLASVQQNAWTMIPFARQASAVGATSSAVPTIRSLAPMGAVSGGGAYEDAKAKGKDDLAALAYGTTQAVVEMATERFPMGAYLNDVKLGSSMAKTISKQIVSENLSEQVATHVQDLVAWGELHPEKTLGEYFAERPNAALQTLVATTVAAGMQTAPGHYAQRIQIRENRAAQAEQAHAALQQLQQVAQGSELNKRAPDAFAGFMQAVADEHGTPEVHVSAEVFNQALTSANIDPASVVAKLPQDVRESYAQAMQTGGDLTMPTGEAVAKLLAAEEGNALVPHLRFGPDDMSFAEREQFKAQEQKQLQDELRELMEAKQGDQAWNDSAKQVEDSVFGQLMATGRATEDAARKQAVLHRTFASVMAGRTGLTPYQFHESALLRVQGAGQGGYEQSPEVGYRTGTQFLEAKTEAGMVGGNVRDGALRISFAKVAEDSRGKGEGGRLYAALIDKALADGLRVFSDSTVEADAVRVYESLKRKGYDVRRLDGGTLDDGAEYGTGAEKPAFEVVAGPSSFAQAGRLGDVVASIEGGGVSLSASERNGLITLHKIVVPEGERSGGKGSDAMQRLVEYADRTGQHVALSPSADFGGDKNRLTEFYKRFGFVENKGKSRAFSTSESMYRQAPGKVLYQNDMSATLTIDGKERPTTNSNGKPIAQTEEGVRNFWRWFGESKVVDAEGRPLVVFHETDADFNEFRISDGKRSKSDGQMPTGAFFKPSPRQIGVTNEGSIQMPVFLSLNNPLEIKDRDALVRLYSKEVQGYNDLVLREEEVNAKWKADPRTDWAIDTEEQEKVFEEAIAAWDEDLNAISSEQKALINAYFESSEYDGIIVDEDAGSLGRSTKTLITFDPSSIKSATGNAGTFDPANPNILAQDARGTFNPDTNTIALLEGANLSTFLHESGHYFLETMLDVAAGPLATPEIKADGQKILDWFGVRDLDEWHGTDLEQRREHHEKWARTFEAYLFEGKAPSVELQGLFRTFRAWLVQVYKSLKNLNADLTPEVRGVMDRMLATDEDIQAAEYARSMMPLWDTPDAAGMDAEQLKALHEAHKDATEEATEKLQARSLRALKWARNAQSKALKELQKEADALRTQEEMEVRREVLARPIYQVWQWLKGRIEVPATPIAPRKSDPDVLDPTIDSLLVAVAKLGGIERESAVNLWGLRPEEKVQSGVFGKHVLRAKGKGWSVDQMAEKLAEQGYLPPDENWNTALRQFEEAFFDEMSGSPHYSLAYEPAPDARPGDLDAFDPMGTGRLDRDSVRMMYGKDHPILAHMESLRVLRKTGYHPDVVAEYFGYESGDAMVRELAVTQDPEVEIEALADQRMLEKHSDLATPEAIQQAADEAVHNEARARAVSAELNALATVSKTRKVPREAAQEFARGMIARLQIDQIKPLRYAAAAARAGKAAQDAIKKGDTARAFVEKRNQLVQTYAAQYANEALAEARQTREQFQKIVTGKDDTVGKTRDLDLVNVARAVLSFYGFTGKAGQAVTYLNKIAEYDPTLYQATQDIVQGAEASAKPFAQLALEEMRGLRAEIESLWHLAKRHRQMEVDGDLLDRQDVAQALRDRLEQIGVPDTMPGDTSAITPKERALKHLQDAAATLRRAESWADRMDGAERMGAFRRYIFTPIKEAADTYRKERAKSLRALRDALAPVRDTFQRELIAAPELGYTFGKESGAAMNELLHALLHTGNESNKRKLLLGRGWAQEFPDGTVDTSRWDAFVSRMTQEGKITRAHFDTAQRVWDLLESMKPAAQRAHRDAFGKYFDEVAADAFTVRFSDGSTANYRGGYIPATPDSRIVKDNELRKLVEEGKDSMAYAFPGTAKGFTKSRVEYNRPLMLDVRTLGQHIDKVLLFSHMEMPVRDAARLIGMPQVSHALNRVDPAAISGVLTPWLNRSARQQVTTPVPGAQGLMRVLSELRSRTGMALMFANMSNTVQQLAGFSIAVVKVPPGQLLRATADFIAHPVDLARNVAEASDYMAHRMDNQAEAMMGEVHEMLVNPTAYQSAQEWSKRNAYFLQSAMDNVMGPIIWTGAYRDAVAAGMDDRDAVRLADAAIRQTQGSTLPEDVSRIETGPAYARLFTQFVGYFNMQGNLLATELAKAKDTGGKAGAMRAASVVFMGFLASAWIAEFVAQAFRGGPGDDDKDGEYLDDWLRAVFLSGPIKNATALIPFAGSAIQTTLNTFNGNPVDDRMSISPVVSMVESAAMAGRSVYQATEDGNSQRAVRQMATALTLATGLPLYTLSRPVGYAAGVEQGKIDPTSAADALRGMLTGAASPTSKVR
jgi:GNAT superfamily N-acetyltransferase